MSNEFVFFLASSFVGLAGLSAVFFLALWTVRYAGRALDKSTEPRRRAAALALSLVCLGAFVAAPLVAWAVWLALLTEW